MLLRIYNKENHYTYSFIWNDIKHVIDDNTKSNSSLDGMKLFMIKNYFIDQMNQHVLALKRDKEFIPKPLVVPHRYWIKLNIPHNITIVNSDRQFKLDIKTLIKEQEHFKHKDYFDMDDFTLLLLPEFKKSIRTIVQIYDECKLGHLQLN